MQLFSLSLSSRYILFYEKKDWTNLWIIITSKTIAVYFLGSKINRIQSVVIKLAMYAFADKGTESNL